MQVIGSTYAAYRDPRFHPRPYAYGTSEDPMGNIRAAREYTRRHYGSLSAWGQRGGYDKGGWLAPGTSVAYNNTGRPIRVSPLSPRGGPLVSAPRLVEAIKRSIRLLLRLFPS
jgi:hypothetical protein